MHFLSGKFIWEYRLQNVGYFVGLNVLNIHMLVLN